MPAIPYDRFRRELLELYAPPLRAKATRGQLRQVLDEFATAATPRTTADLTPAAIGRWIAAHPHRGAIRAYSLLRSLRAACTYARKMGYLGVDPFAWRTPAQWLNFDDDAGLSREKFDRHLTADQMAGLLATADREAEAGDWEPGRLRALVYALAYTGARKGELLGLRVADLDLPARLLRLRSHPRRRLKTRGSAAPLALADPLLAILTPWLARCGGVWVFPGKTLAGPWLAGGPGVRALDQIRALGVRAGIAGLTMLGFRHTVGSLAEGWGVGELELQRWLRHARRRTQDSYRSADLDVIRGTAGKIHYRPAG